MVRLTVAGVKAAKSGRHADGLDLYLLVKPTGARSWLLRVQYLGRRRDIGLGSVDFSARRFDDPINDVPLIRRKSLTLAEAREKAAILRKLAQAGLDPVTERDREKRRIPTFAEAVDLAHQEFAKGWVDKHAAAFKASLKTHIVPSLGPHRVDIIDHAMVRDALAGIWTEKPVMARKLRVRINQVLGFCKARNWRTRDLPDAREVRTGLAKHGRAEHFAAMPFKAVPEFLPTVLAGEDMPGRLALAFAILTAARSGEVRNATWEQVDLEDRTWTRPADIMKMRVAHVIPLSDAAITLLGRAKPLSGGKGFVFPGKHGKPLSDMTLTKALRTAGQAEITVHGFRSSFRDWAAEMMPTVPAMVAEMALAHAVGTETERAYLRSDLQDQRRALMAAWGAYVVGKTAKNVTPIKRAR
jgi:integrase